MFLYKAFNLLHLRIDDDIQSSQIYQNPFFPKVIYPLKDIYPASGITLTELFIHYAFV